MFDAIDIAEALAAGLKAHARLEDQEQAVYGFDARAELGLHPLLQQALRSAGWMVHPEERYPMDRLRPARSQGQRCDLVVTRETGKLRDPLAEGTLFGDAGVDPQEALWLEVKTVAQFTTLGPFPRYSAELAAPVPKDVSKLWHDDLIRHSALLLVLFTADRTIADHDLAAWHSRCLDRKYPVGTPAIRGFSITDRIGNGWCALAVFPIRGC